MSAKISNRVTADNRPRAARTWKKNGIFFLIILDKIVSVILKKIEKIVKSKTKLTSFLQFLPLLSSHSSEIRSLC